MGVPPKGGGSNSSGGPKGKRVGSLPMEVESRSTISRICAGTEETYPKGKAGESLKKVPAGRGNMLVSQECINNDGIR